MMHEQRWTIKKISQRIALAEQLVYRQTHPIEAFRFTALENCRQKPLVEENIDDSVWNVIEPGSYWGQTNVNFMLRTSFEIPRTWDKCCPVALFLPLGEAGDFSHPEALAYIDGRAYAACDRHHQEIILPEVYRDGKSHLLALHGWTGIGGWNNLLKGDQGEKLLMRPCIVAQIDQATRDFVAAARVAAGAANALDKNTPAVGLLLNALEDAFKTLDTRQPLGDDFYASIPKAHAILKAGIKKAGVPMDVSIVAAGHSHIDVAWLWTVDQTRRKSGRTFHTALRLMEQFDDYHFTQSQPQLYDYVRQDYPELFEEIKKRIQQGRWEITGGMWVEADCNISGAESLARQFLLGRSFFRKHFGIDIETPILWLPDVFGYSANLPQLIKQAGLEYFFTTKISWNQYNRLPYDSFRWQGIDGTQVLTHFATTPYSPTTQFSTYNAMVTPEQVLQTWTNFQQKELHQQLLIAYGFGDGGGGPTREMLENIHELKNFPAMPQVRQGSAHEFFKKLEVDGADRLPVWNGELYLEFHRGTYTTQSRSKWENRKSEFLLHDAEFLATLASVIDTGYSYPAAEFRKAWELVCLNQFHDIIPGSSIGQVYVDSLKDYQCIRETVQNCQADALKVISDKIAGDVIVINPCSFKRSDITLLSNKTAQGKGLKRADGRDVLTQTVDNGILVAGGELEPFSVTPLMFSDTAHGKRENTLIATQNMLENNFVRVRFNKAGDIVEIYDKINNRNVLPKGAVANHFHAFEDRPLKNDLSDLGDAWDIDIYFEDKMWASEPASSVKVVETGPLRAMLEIRRRILHSEYVQRISLTYNSPRIDFDTEINWHEKHILLKAAFPVEILSPVATFEVQWGNVERPTHRNTSWDWARFEVCAQKWIDLSEGNYGVSLLNDCKYGFDAKDNVMRISLLRGTIGPDINADQGQHQFKYSLLPHAGNLSETTVSAAYMLNDPMIAVISEKPVRSTRNDKQFNSFVAADCPNIVIETIKQAENGKGIIVRLYESLRKRGTVTLTTNFEIAEAMQTNLIEDEQKELEHSQNQVRLFVKPFEIATLRLVPRRSKSLLLVV
ncbi:MAG: alpha-mannosidase [Sedimentisphaerales bacterium]